MAEASRTSYYDVLGVAPGAGAQDIKDAYRRAVRTAHPDLGGSAAEFHAVTVAYETLADPRRRERYDADTGRGRPAPAPASGPSRTRTGPRRPPRTEDDDAVKVPPVYEPEFSPSEPPVVPLILAGQQAHGSPRQPRMFARLSTRNAARVDGETRTAALLERTLLPTYPAARLVNGVEFEDREKTTAGHLVLAGDRLAVIDSFAAPPGNFSWDGRVLRHQGRSVELQVPHTVRLVQELLPDLDVAGWLVIHGAPDNPFAPVIDVPPGFDRTAPGTLQVTNAGTAVRTIRSFLSAGPRPTVVQLPVLARLLALTDG